MKENVFADKYTEKLSENKIMNLKKEWKSIGTNSH